MSMLDAIKEGLKQEIKEAAERTGLVDTSAMPEITLEIPKEKQHGDFSTNLAMQLTKLAKKNPREIAQQLTAAINTKKASIIHIDIAGPGFINFFMDKSYLQNVIPDIIRQNTTYGTTNLGKGQRVQVEFVSANPTGSLHLGHARGAAVGDALCNVLTMAGYKVSREYYINDAGNQVVNLAKSIEARYLQAIGQDVPMPEDGYHGEDIIQFAKELVDEKQDQLTSLSDTDRHQYLMTYGLKKEMDKLKFDLNRFGVNFDMWFSESSLYQDGQIEVTLKELKDRGHIYEEEGATWLRTMDFGDDKNRVLIKNDGSYTYLLPDIAYHLNKFNRGFDSLINIWGADHHGYIPRVKAAMVALGYPSERLTVLIAQMVSLYQNGEKIKMSKRTGKAVTMNELMDEVGIDAVRYFFTMRGMDAHLDFDMDLAISKSNENPVFYVQYAHARICSIFRQAAEQGIILDASNASAPVDFNSIDYSLLNTEAEQALLNKMAEFSDEIRIAAQQYAPHRIVRYVYELAAMFHSYYKAERVIIEDAALTQARLALLSAVRIVIRNSLQIIGVSSPEQM